MSTKKTDSCPVMGCGGDVVTKALGKIGVNRSMMITLALVPFAWRGVVECLDFGRGEQVHAPCCSYGTAQDMIYSDGFWAGWRKLLCVKRHADMYC